MSVTAKVKLGSKIQYPTTDHWGGFWTLNFMPDYDDGRNAEWANASPSLSLTMVVRDDVHHLFEQGQAYTLTFTPSED